MSGSNPDQSFKIHASIVNLDKVIEDAIKSAFKDRQTFEPGHPDYETLVAMFREVATSLGVELSDSDIPLKFVSPRHKITFDPDMQLSCASREHIANSVRLALSSARIVVSMREEKAIGSGVSLSSEQLHSFPRMTAFRIICQDALREVYGKREIVGPGGVNMGFAGGTLPSVDQSGE